MDADNRGRGNGPGGTFIVSAGEPYALDFSAPTELILIEIAPGFVAPEGDEDAQALGRIRPAGTVHDGVLAALGTAVAAEHRGRLPPSSRYLESAGHLLAAHLLRRCTGVRQRTSAAVLGRRWPASVLAVRPTVNNSAPQPI